jgi:hypothetical protein
MQEERPASLPRVDPEDSLRNLLFEHAAKLNLRINQRIEYAAGHFANGNADGVLGSLDGADNDIATIRILMMFVRDNLPPTTK